MGIARDCAGCGVPATGDECEGCGSPTTTPKQRPIGDLGRAILVGKGLEAREGIIALDGGTSLKAILKNQGLADVDRADCSLGRRLGGIDAALSPAGGLLLLAESGAPRWGQVEPTTLWQLANQNATTNIESARLLALDAARSGRLDEVLPKLSPLTTTERTWLRAHHFADAGHWDQVMAQLGELPAELYLSRIGLIYRGRAILRQHPELGIPAAQWLRAQLPADPAARLLARIISNAAGNDGDVADIRLRTEELTSLAPLVPSSRAADLAGALGRGKSIKKYDDVSAAVRPYEAVTSRRRWFAQPDDFAGRSIEFIDELVDRGRIPARSLPDFVAVLPERHRAYLKARIDPQRLSDDEVFELDMPGERLRRLLLSGDTITVADMPGGDSAVEQLKLKESALRGSVEALTELRLQLDESEWVAISAATEAVVRGEIPDEQSATDLTLWPYFSERVEPARLIAAKKTDLGAAQARFVAWAALRSSKKAIFEWREDEALQLAKKVLEMSREEVLRDEALNLIAAVHWHAEREKEAIRAIKTALDGLYTTSLQVNGVVVASTASAKDGIEIMAGLITDAPDLNLRLSAARRVMALYSDDGNEGLSTATTTRALRDLAKQPMPFDDFLPMAEFLCEHDATWMQGRNAFKQSPHRNRPETKVLQARAKGLSEMFKALSTQLRADPRNEWLRNQREMWLRILIRNLATEPDVLVSASLGYEILDSRMPMDAADNVILTLLCAREFTFVIDTDEACLRDDRVDGAIAAMKRLESLDWEDKERIREVCDACIGTIATHVMTFYGKQLVDNTPHAFLPDATNRQRVREGSYWCRQGLEAAEKLLPVIRNYESKMAVRNVISTLRGTLASFSSIY